MKKKRLLISFCALLLLAVPSIEINAVSQFQGQEDYYLDFCAGILKTDADVATCVSFKKYYASLQQGILDNLDKIEGDLASIKGDMSKLMATINEINADVKTVESRLATVEKNITKMEKNILQLEEEIEEKQKDIDARDEQIKLRMVAMQQFIGVNGYIDFIMGANDLVDLVRRASGVEKITSYDKEQIALLKEDMDALNADKKELERQKETLDEQKAGLVEQKAVLVSLQNKNNELMASYKSKEAEYEASYREQQVSLSTIANNMPNINTSRPEDLPNVETNTGFVFPVRGSYYKSAGTWNYPASFGGGLHQGVDYAAAVGTPLVAPANALILYANNPCPTYSAGLGDRCGYPTGGGNTVLMVMEVAGTTYAVHYNHMARENFVAKGLSSVNQGQVIGAIGTSGNSTGAHVHIEVINLGSMGMYNALQKFNATGDFNFGTGWRGGYRCENGVAAPCKERPESIFGV
ncbi:MAG: murein hydrolase activator EnvC family protein [Erysipelotrichaceae bacterium]